MSPETKRSSQRFVKLGQRDGCRQTKARRSPGKKSCHPTLHFISRSHRCWAANKCFPAPFSSPLTSRRMQTSRPHLSPGMPTTPHLLHTTVYSTPCLTGRHVLSDRGLLVIRISLLRLSFTPSSLPPSEPTPTPSPNTTIGKESSGASIAHRSLHHARQT